MRKLLFGLIVILAWACSEDQVMMERPIEKSDVSTATVTRSTSSGLGVDREVLYLKDDSTRHAGTLSITANVPEVTLRWNFPDSCNVDTTRTHLALKNGAVKLDIKWEQMLEEGNFGPFANAFDGGVLISDGSTAIYVHLIWSESKQEELYQRILTRSASDVAIMPKAAGISLSEKDVKMNYYNGKKVRLKATGVEYVAFGWEEIGAFSNIDISKLPEYEEGDVTKWLEFSWVGGNNGAPTNPFRIPFYLIAEEDGLSTSAEVSYTIAEDDTLSITPNELTIVPMGGSATTKVTTNYEKWEVTTTNIPEWLTLSAMEGSKGTSTLTFTAKNNTTNEERSVTIYLKTKSKTRGVIINQLGVIPSLTVTPQSFPGISPQGATVNLEVTSNKDWSITSALPSWITPSIHTGNGSASISFIVAPNTLYQERTYSLTIGTNGGAGGPTQTVVFTQNALAPNTLTVTASSTTIGSTGGVPTLTVTSNTNWSVTSDVAWARVIDATGTGNGTSDIVIQENTGTTARVATITVTSTSGSPVITKTITITQQPKNTTVTPGGNVTIGDYQDQNVDINGGDI